MGIVGGGLKLPQHLCVVRRSRELGVEYEKATVFSDQLVEQGFMLTYWTLKNVAARKNGNVQTAELEDVQRCAP